MSTVNLILANGEQYSIPTTFVKYFPTIAAAIDPANGSSEDESVPLNVTKDIMDYAMKYYHKYEKAVEIRGKKFTLKHPYVPQSMINYSKYPYGNDGVELKRRCDFFTKCMDFANFVTALEFLHAVGSCIGKYMWEGRTVEQLRFLSGEVDDFTPEEKEQIRIENECCEVINDEEDEDEDNKSDFGDFVDATYKSDDEEDVGEEEKKDDDSEEDKKSEESNEDEEDEEEEDEEDEDEEDEDEENNNEEDNEEEDSEDNN